MELRKRYVIGLLAFCLTIGVLVIFSGSHAFAATATMNESEYCFDGSSKLDEVPFWPVDGMGDTIWNKDVGTAVSSDPKVAKVTEINNETITVKPIGEGVCTISITFKDGDTGSVKITVKKNFNTGYLGASTTLNDEVDDYGQVDYGTKTIKIYSLPGTTGKLKIGKESHKYKVNSKGKATVKLKKVYKLGTKLILTGKNTTLNGSPSFKKIYRIKSVTEVHEAKSAGNKKVRIYVYYPHKGDKVKLTYKGKSYTKKFDKRSIKKGYITIELKNKIPKTDTTMRYKVINMYKQVLDKGTFTLYGGTSTEDYEEHSEE